VAVSLDVKDFKVRSLDADFNELSWKVGDSRESALDYQFFVLRSESPEGPFDFLGTPFSDRYIFIDNAIKADHRWRKYFYKLRVVHIPSGDTKDFGPFTKEPDADLIALELRRHMQLLFREFNGRRCFVLPVRTFGQRCECWNDALQKKNRSGCPLCYDTGFVRGYLSPIESWVQIEPSPKSEQNTVVGAQQQSNTTAKLAWYPPLKPRDLIIEPENRRWRVISVVSTEHGRAPIHQEVQLHEIPQKDIEFKIPLELDTALKDLWLAPSRNFTNPQNLDAFEGSEFLDIFNDHLNPPRRR
jgi:hypothetical protein